MSTYVTNLALFGVNVSFMLMIYRLAYLSLLAEWAGRRTARELLIACLLLHATRVNGAAFVMEGVVSGLDPVVGWPALLGDFAAAALALLAAWGLHRRSGWAVPAAWAFTAVGLLDLAQVGAQIVIFRVDPAHLGAMYYLVCCVVTLLMLTHVWVIKLLRAPALDGRVG